MKLPRISLSLGLVTLAAGGLAVYAVAGSLEPPGPPAPTMVTLNEIYGAVQSLAAPDPGTFRSASMGVSDTAGGTVVLMQVTPGKRFVLKDVLLMAGPADSWNHLYDGSEYKVTFGMDDPANGLVSKHFGLQTGIVFSAGATINIECHGAGNTITIMGYEF